MLRTNKKLTPLCPLAVLLLSLTLLLSACSHRFPAGTSAPPPTQPPTATTIPQPSTPEELYLDETDTPLLALLEEASDILDSGLPIQLKQNRYLDIFYKSNTSVSQYVDKKDGVYVIHSKDSSEVQHKLRYMVFLDLLLDRFQDCLYDCYIPNASIDRYYLTYCANYKELGYDSIEEYASDGNRGTHRISYQFAGVYKSIFYEYDGSTTSINLADLPNSFPQHKVISTNRHYSVLRRRYAVVLDFPDEAPAIAPEQDYVSRSSLSELISDILTGNFTESELLTIQNFAANKQGDIEIFNIEADFSLQLPDGLEVQNVRWDGIEFRFELAGNGLTGYLNYDEYGRVFSGSLAEYHDPKFIGNPDYSYNKYFSYEAGSFYVLECYQRSVSQSAPTWVKFWKSGEDYFGCLEGFRQPPTDEWMYSIKLTITLKENQ